MTLTLAIETSCDETAAAVVEDGRHILSNVVASQIDLHRRYGGVFPEVASRQHVLTILPVISQAREQAGVGWTELDAVAVTEGPGLAGSLLVGVNAAKGIAFGHGLPLIAVNHLEGHVYSNWLVPEVRKAPGHESRPAIAQPQFPILVLIVSGGHTELVLMEGHGQYRRLGGTLDDAAGEAFDKVARLLGLAYPGGPALQAAAQGGNADAFDLPRALTNKPEHRYNFSFSGLKTAVLRLAREQQATLGDETWPEAYSPQGLGQEGDDLAEITPALAAGRQIIRDIAASFQASVADSLVTKTLQAAEDCGVAQVYVCGGVAANQELRRQLATRMTLPHAIPPLWLCTDNAAMIGAAAHYRFVAGIRSSWDLDVKARWPLDSWG